MIFAGIFALAGLFPAAAGTGQPPSFGPLAWAGKTYAEVTVVAVGAFSVCFNSEEGPFEVPWTSVPANIQSALKERHDAALASSGSAPVAAYTAMGPTESAPPAGQEEAEQSDAQETVEPSLFGSPEQPAQETDVPTEPAPEAPAAQE